MLSRRLLRRLLRGRSVAAAAWVFVGLLLAALSSLVTEEIKGWVELLPRAILRFAAARRTSVCRKSIYGEWLVSLDEVARGAESRPITRLVRGIRFAVCRCIFEDQLVANDTASHEALKSKLPELEEDSGELVESELAASQAQAIQQEEEYW